MKLNVMLMSLILALAHYSWAGFAKSMNEKYDVLIILDDSGSMFQHQDHLKGVLPNLLKEFSGKDFQLGLQTTSALNQRSLVDSVELMGPSTSGDYGHIISHVQGMIQDFKFNGSAEEKFFNSIVPILTSPVNTGFMREDAKLVVLIISNEDDQSLETPKQLVTDLLEYKKFKDIEVHGLLSIGLDFCSSPAKTTKIMDLVAMTGGQSFDICASDWSDYQIQLSN
jgi:hypothetical protein